MSGGGSLQRRRVAAAAAADASEHNGSSCNPGSSRNSPDLRRRGSSDQRGDDAGDDDDQDKYAPRLTLMEEVLLLGLKDKQGYLSFWNDNISYVLRGCILMELSLRNRIAVVKEPGKRKPQLSDRVIEVVNDKLTGEVLLDEAIKMIKSSDKMSIASWIDLMSGETWNVMKIGYQLKQVRERLAKGLVDKGILRTEKRNFLLFDMATHPVADSSVKEEIVRRVCELLTRPPSTMSTQGLSASPSMQRPYGSNSVPSRASGNLTHLRTIAMVCAAYAANVLENALVSLSHDARERAYVRVDELLSEYSVWPPGSPNNGYGLGNNGVGGPAGRSESAMVGVGESAEKDGTGREILSSVLNVFTKMDSIL